jgi:hypothetical protein
VAENRAQHLVLHRHVGLAANVVLELRLNYAERRLDIAPFEAMGVELLPFSMRRR